MKSVTTTPSFLVLAANTPWVYALGQSLVDTSPTTAVRLFDLPNYRRLKPQWPEVNSAVHRVSIVMPQGYAGTLEPLFRPLMRSLIVREQLRLRRISGVDPIVVVPYPYLAPWVRGVPSSRLVYYNLDEYPHYEPARTLRILENESELVARAGLTVCLSEHQVKTLRGRNPERAARIRHFPLGLVEDFLNPRPDEPAWPNTVGYVGNLGDRVDWSLFFAVAVRLPDAKFHVVGKLEDNHGDSVWQVERKRTLALPNVVYEGEVAQAQVREHYWRYAVNWMPYDTNHGFNIASCPTKIMDALASGRPFLSTDIPEVRLYSNRIAIAATAEDAADLLRARLSGRATHDAREQVVFAARHTWPKRAIEFRRLTSSALIGEGTT